MHARFHEYIAHAKMIVDPRICALLPKEAEYVSKAQAASDPKQRSIYYSDAALSLSEREEYYSAKAYINMAINIFPDLLTNYIFKANCCLFLGDKTGACDCYSIYTSKGGETNAFTLDFLKRLKSATLSDGPLPKNPDKKTENHNEAQSVGVSSAPEKSSSDEKLTYDQVPLTLSAKELAEQLDKSLDAKDVDSIARKLVRRPITQENEIYVTRGRVVLALCLYANTDQISLENFDELRHHLDDCYNYLLKGLISAGASADTWFKVLGIIDSRVTSLMKKAIATATLLIIRGIIDCFQCARNNYTSSKFTLDLTNKLEEFLERNATEAYLALRLKLIVFDKESQDVMDKHRLTYARFLLKNTKKEISQDESLLKKAEEQLNAVEVNSVEKSSLLLQRLLLAGTSKPKKIVQQIQLLLAEHKDNKKPKIIAIDHGAIINLIITMIDAMKNNQKDYAKLNVAALDYLQFVVRGASTFKIGEYTNYFIKLYKKAKGDNPQEMLKLLNAQIHALSESNPSKGELYLLRARTLIELRRDKEAIQDCDTAMKYSSQAKEAGQLKSQFNRNLDDVMKEIFESKESPVKKRKKPKKKLSSLAVPTEPSTGVLPLAITPEEPVVPAILVPQKNNPHKIRLRIDTTDLTADKTKEILYKKVLSFDQELKNAEDEIERNKEISSESILPKSDVDWLYNLDQELSLIGVALQIRGSSVIRYMQHFYGTSSALIQVCDIDLYCSFAIPEQREKFLGIYKKFEQFTSFNETGFYCSLSGERMSSRKEEIKFDFSVDYRYARDKSYDPIHITRDCYLKFNNKKTLELVGLTPRTLKQWRRNKLAMDLPDAKTLNMSSVFARAFYYKYIKLENKYDGVNATKILTDRAWQEQFFRDLSALHEQQPKDEKSRIKKYIKPPYMNPCYSEIAALLKKHYQASEGVQYTCFSHPQARPIIESSLIVILEKQQTVSVAGIPDLSHLDRNKRLAANMTTILQLYLAARVYDKNRNHWHELYDIIQHIIQTKHEILSQELSQERMTLIVEELKQEPFKERFFVKPQSSHQSKKPITTSTTRAITDSLAANVREDQFDQKYIPIPVLPLAQSVAPMQMQYAQLPLSLSPQQAPYFLWPNGQYSLYPPMLPSNHLTLQQGVVSYPMHYGYSMQPLR